MGGSITRRNLFKLAALSAGAAVAASNMGCASGQGTASSASSAVGSSGVVSSEGASSAPSSAQPGAFVTSFVVMSDAHVSDDSDVNNEHFDNALKDIATFQPAPATIVILGDMTNSGIPEQYDLLRSICDDNGYDLDDDFVLVMGNHEQYNDSFDPALAGVDVQYLEFMAQAGVDSLYFDTEVDGQHLICLGPDKNESGSWVRFGLSAAQLEWLAGQLDADAAAGRTSYVFCHEPLLNTVRHTEPGSWVERNCLEDDAELAAVLAGRANVIYFSGHTHMYPDWARPDQAGPLYVNDGAVGPGQLERDVWNYDPESPKGSHGWLVSVFEDRVELKARNFLDRAWIDGMAYTFATAGE